jgi:putative addiction module killer protein
VYEVRDYVTFAGKDVFAEWRKQVRDVRVRFAIDRRVGRMVDGNFGDHKYLRDGVYELRLDLGPGFRVYYSFEGNKVILLLLGGDKGSQRTDIDKACSYWKDWQERTRKAGNAHEPRD